MDRIGIGFAGSLSPMEIVECVQLAEELGYDSAWMAEAHGGDQFSILTACAMATNTIKLGTNISSVFVRSAPTIAMAAACVDYYSNGRFILGLGSSHRVQVGPEHGEPYVEPLQRLLETVDIVRALLRDGVASYQGKVINIEQFDFWFEPLRNEIPIYLAAVRPRMTQIAGEISDGVLLAIGTVEHRRESVKNVLTGVATAGREPQEVDIAAGLACVISEDRAKARNAVRQSLATTIGIFPRYRTVIAESGFPEEVEAVRKAWSEGDKERAVGLVPDGLIDALAVTGTAEECQERIHEYRKAGITLPIISPGVGRSEFGDDDPKKVAFQVIRTCAP